MKWTFLSNHAHILLILHKDPDARIRDIAEQVDITQRAVQRILKDLVDEEYVQADRVGRRNHYRLNRKALLRHPLESGTPIGKLLSVLKPEKA